MRSLFVLFFAALAAFGASPDSLRLSSPDVRDGAPLPPAQRSAIFGAGGQDLSPRLSWSGAPSGTRSYAVTVYDPDAPTGSGFWHWAVCDIPASVTELAAGAGSPGKEPAGARTLPNDAGLERFLGAAPPKGHGRHRYVFTVYAVDVPHLELSAHAAPAMLGFQLFRHTLAKASLTAWSETN